ncbi:MAG TPA: NPCBM/NEW2 domain-containing protein [Tepidisphaeraceae bacterium]|nr:NPCBM/NEW2 domain-containing protein [Tepidisphaeraceae bacterium]
MRLQLGEKKFARRNTAAISEACSKVVEPLENRVMLAAHIAGSSTVYSTIQAAVNAASAGAVITVDAGSYPEEVTVTKSLTIEGAEAGIDARQTTRLNGPTSEESIVTGAVKSGVDSAAFDIAANDVTLDGFTVQGETDQGLTTSAGILISPGVSGTHIVNNILQNNVSGLFLANSSSTDAALIQHNVFRNNNNNGINGGRGIYSDQSVSGGNLTNVTIDSNAFTNNFGGDGTTNLEAACALEATVAGKQSNIRITNNTMTGNGKGVLIFDASNIFIEGNTVTTSRDQYSGTMRFEGNVQNVVMEYNTIFSNTGPGVAVDSKGAPGLNSGFVVNFNNIYNNNNAYATKMGVVYDATVYSGTFDARYNWWGNVTGPSGNGTGTGDAVSAGAFQPGSGLGWSLTTGGITLYSPWSTALNAVPGALPPAPIAVSAVAAGVTQINLSWTDTAYGLETGFIIQRSTDGVNFAQVGTTAAAVTQFADTTATGGTTYTYRVASTNANGASPFSAVASTTTPAAGSITTNLSSVNWVSATAGYDTVQKNHSINGNPITLNGTVYATGIGTHAASQIVYNLAGRYTNFISDIGIDSEENGVGNGEVDFQVLGDGKLLYDSGDLTNPSLAVSINVNVTGVQVLTLIANNGIANNINYDHADWAGAKLLSSGLLPPTAPSGLSAVATLPTQVNLAWTNNGLTATGTLIQRSTDGVNFTQIASVGATVSSYADTTAAGGTAYTYRIAATNANGSSAFTPVATATTPAAGSTITNLSTLSWVSAVAGYGTVQKNLSINGNPITLNGVTYSTGIGTHAVSNIVYNLNGAYTNFVSDIGVDGEEQANGGSLIFEVIGDNGAILYNSGILTNTSPTVSIDVNVTGVKTLTLNVTNGIAGNINYDHADWAGAKLISSSAQVPLAPSGLTGVAISSTQVNLSWTNNAPNATGFVIDRSTDGVNFTQIATTAAGVTTFTDTSAAAGTTNTYEVAAVNAAGNSAFSNTVAVATPAAGSITTYLSTLNWTSASAGYGTVQKNLSINGNPLTLNGVTYASGIGTHAVSNIVYNLGGAYTNFISDIGVDGEEQANGGAVIFEVIGDNGAILYNSGVLTNTSATVSIDVNVTGVQTLTLNVTNGIAGNIDYDHADWAGAKLISSSAQAPVAPSGLTGLAISPTQVNLSWTNNAPNATGFVIDRSTDGVNFTQIGTTAAGITSFTDTAAAAGTTNTYEVAAVNSAGNSPFTPGLAIVTPAAGAITTYLSDLNWVSATAGYGTVQKNLSINGNPITLNGVTYAKGIGTHAVSDIVYNLNGAYTNFLSDIGIDGEEKGNGGAVDFQVIGDGKVLFDSGVLTNTSPTVTLDVNVTGVKTLTLIATNTIAGSIDYDHADWAGAKLLSSPGQAPVAPSGLTGVAVNPAQVNLAWTNNAPNATGFAIFRSTDGLNFAQIATTAANVTSYSDTAAVAGATDTYEVAATNSGGNSPFSNTVAVATPAAGSIGTNLSALNWVSAMAGYATVQKNLSILGNPIRLNGVVYSTGIGTHAASTIVYNLAGAYTNFISDIGIDSEEVGKGSGSVDFQVIGDGKVLFDSGILTSASPTVTLDVNVTGVQTLTLQATNGIAGSIDYDHADWAGARLLSAPAGGSTQPTALVDAAVPSTISALRIVNAAAPAVSTPWMNISVGKLGQLGSATNTGSTFTIAGAGTGVAQAADALDYVYQTLAGNGTIVAHLDSAQMVGDQAGLLIRETAAAGAKDVALLITQKGTRFAHRAKTGGTTAATTKSTKATPDWLKLVRKGNTFTAYDSVDGIHWKKAGSTRIKMNATVEMGLAVASGASAVLNSSVFSDVAVSM